MKRNIAVIVAVVLAGWFVWMGVQAMNHVEAAQAKRAAQIEALTR